MVIVPGSVISAIVLSVVVAGSVAHAQSRDPCALPVIGPDIAVAGEPVTLCFTPSSPTPVASISWDVDGVPGFDAVTTVPRLTWTFPSPGTFNLYVEYSVPGSPVPGTVRGPIRVVPKQPACGNGRDDDGDGLRDGQEPGCYVSGGTSEADVVVPTRLFLRGSPNRRPCQLVVWALVKTVPDNALPTRDFPYARRVRFRLSGLSDGATGYRATRPVSGDGLGLYILTQRNLQAGRYRVSVSYDDKWRGASKAQRTFRVRCRR